VRDIAFAIGYVALVLLAVCAGLVLWSMLGQPSTGPAR
jgi:hypothetical protein